ncbi:MAG TPA: plastocyanin/azurin family copper-binding protein [Solirubrobacteraceae bacterium]|jgi:plastocyanin|nr:plastocyanin/azurin family copper-binding protein [Solirubrobacteraceae bacterium]
MRRTLVMLLSLGTLALASGCGGSGSSSQTRRSSGTSSVPAGAIRPGASLTQFKAPKYASPPAGAPVLSGVVQIAYRNITIHPDAIRVKVGSTIRWTNFDTVVHNVTSRSGPSSFASGRLAPGASFQVRLRRPGVLHYLCTIHPVTMNGTIEVVS